MKRSIQIITLVGAMGLWLAGGISPSVSLAQGDEAGAVQAAEPHHIYIHFKEGASETIGQIEVEIQGGRAVAVNLVPIEPAPAVEEEPVETTAETAPAEVETSAETAEPAAGLITTPPAEEETAETAVAAADTQAGAEGSMGLLVFVFVMAIFLGFELISKVPSQLHTPLMSGSNAISGITIVGALLAVGLGEGKTMMVLGTLAVAFAAINVVGGYVVTDRMLGMFKHKD